MTFVLPASAFAQTPPKPAFQHINTNRNLASPTQLPATLTSKLSIINKLRHDLKIPALQNLPPAKIVLTPAAPVYDANNWVSVIGFYQPSLKLFAVKARANASASNSDNLFEVRFITIPGKTYLLDVTVSGGDNTEWKAASMSGPYSAIGTNSVVKPQQGHILIPFVPGYEVNTFHLMPLSSYPGWFRLERIELTQVN